MDKLYYPAIFQKQEGGYTVVVPDFDGCITQGDTLAEARKMAVDAIGLCIEDLVDRKLSVPTASDPTALKVQNGACVVLIDFDWAEYQKRHDSRVVKKTVTLPAWLNTLAEENHVNFSRMLQDALAEHLHLVQ